MADEVKNEQEKLDEGATEFGSGPRNAGSFFWPTGFFGRWFSKFFHSDARPYLAKQTRDNETPLAPRAGDTHVATEVIKLDGPAGGISRIIRPQLPQLEINRKERYRSFEKMDEYPEIGAAFDTYADDSTQRDIKGECWEIVSKSQEVLDEVSALFKKIKLKKKLWDIIRNACKYGDCFIEQVVDLNNTKAGIQRVKILNPNYILRVENEYGYLVNFLQEIPDATDWSSYMMTTAREATYIALDKNQIVHFRLSTSNPNFYPYGKSIAALAVHIFRSLKMMEDAMLIYRLTRAPERRIFYVDVGQLPATKAEMYMERLIEKFKKQKYYNPQNNNIDARYNPLSQDEDFFVPVRGGQQGTKIETLPGAQNLGDVDDVKYFRDKLLACLKIPKDYIVEFDKSPQRKANLAQLDVKFARVIVRVQEDMETGLETIAKRHLQIKGFPQKLINDLEIKLPDPSDMFAKRKLDLDERKTQIVTQLLQTQMFPKKYLYEEYYNLSDLEIDRLEKMLEEEQEEMMDQQNQMAQDQMMAGGGMGAPMGGSPQDMDMGAAPDMNSTGEMESPSNKQVPENVENKLKMFLESKEFHDFNERKIVNRLLEKFNDAK